MFEKLLLKLRARVIVDAADQSAIESLAVPLQRVRKGATIVPSATMLRHSVLLIEGFASRVKDVGNGERQIMELHVPGDFVDLHSYTLKYLDHSVLAASDCVIARITHDRIAEVTAASPSLTRMLWFSTNLDASIHRQWMLSLGRRSAVSRLAHLLCELEVRLEIAGLARGGRYRLPLTQTHLAECLGLTSVHVNRTLRTLREDGLATFSASEVVILNRAGLRRVAEFSPDYLYVKPPAAA